MLIRWRWRQHKLLPIQAQLLLRQFSRTNNLHSVNGGAGFLSLLFVYTLSSPKYRLDRTWTPVMLAVLDELHPLYQLITLLYHLFSYHHYHRYLFYFFLFVFPLCFILRFFVERDCSIRPPIKMLNVKFVSSFSLFQQTRDAVSGPCR